MNVYDVKSKNKVISGLVCAVLVVMVLLLLCACISYTPPEPLNPPKLKAYTLYADIQTQYLYYNYKGQAFYSGVTVIDGNREPREYLHYVTSGETVFLELTVPEGTAQPKVWIIDEIYTKDGYPEYNKPQNRIPIEFADGTASFVVADHVGLRPNPDNQGYHSVIRGFTLCVEFDDYSCDYFFAIRSGLVSPGASSEDSVLEQESDEPIWIDPVKTYDIRGMSVYWYMEAFDFPDDRNAQLILYTDAQTTDNGGFNFNDGNTWALLLKSSDGIFALLPPEYVQFGSVDVTVFFEQNKSDDRFHVLATLTTSDGVEIMDFIYNEDEGAFVEQSVFSVSNVKLGDYSR